MVAELRPPTSGPVRLTNAPTESAIDRCPVARRHATGGRELSELNDAIAGDAVPQCRGHRGGPPPTRHRNAEPARSTAVRGGAAGANHIYDAETTVSSLILYRAGSVVAVPDTRRSRDAFRCLALQVTTENEHLGYHRRSRQSREPSAVQISPLRTRASVRQPEAHPAMLWRGDKELALSSHAARIPELKKSRQRGADAE